MSDSASIKPASALLFDLGGVVFDIDFGQAFQHWANHAGVPTAEVAGRFSFDSSYARLERGEIAAQEYFQCLRVSLAIDIDDAQFAEGWNRIFLDEIADLRPLLLMLRGRVPVSAFSNTNPVHQAAWTRRYPELRSYFDDIYVSWQLGHRKPEAQAYAMVANLMGCAPDEILFFDDTPANVAGARDAGFQAVHVRSTEDVRHTLKRLLPDLTV